MRQSDWPGFFGLSQANYNDKLTDLSQVRCDAASLGVPCTNCVAFAIECRIPTPKRKKNQQPRNKDNNGYVTAMKNTRTVIIIGYEELTSDSP